VPDSIFALAVLLVAVVPGFLFLQGYHRGRDQPIAPDLFVIAKAGVASLVFVTVLWAVPGWSWLEDGSTVVDWIRDKEFDEHREYFLVLVWLGFSLAYFSGLAIGWAIDRLGGHPVIGRLLAWAGLLRPRSLWSLVLERELAVSSLVVVRLKDGREILGAFDSTAAATPDLRELVLPLYVVDDDTGTVSPDGRVLYLRGEEIASIAISRRP
jgi:hypothetical protein